MLDFSKNQLNYVTVGYCWSFVSAPPPILDYIFSGQEGCILTLAYPKAK
jgi:hypothetical protein